MALVAHKYMTEEMNEAELQATFAAREHTLEFLVNRLREQTHAKTLTSFLITGPRGSGKTTLVLMLCLRIRDDKELRHAWFPVRFPEELPGTTSLRDLLVATLDRLSEDYGLAEAREWHARAEKETNDEQSQEIAITGLRQITQKQQKRLILFIENLHQLFERKLDDQAQATFRKLLMVEPFMMMVGTSVRVFEAVQDYEEPFFNYFSQIPLERLSDEQVRQILFQRAEYDDNENFEDQYRQHQGKIQAITRLTGGNPRLLLLLYEVLSEGKLGSTVAALRQVIDELTPLIKDILENQFTEQQTKVIDALMKVGGTAKPSEIARGARLSLNSVTTQLQRLKEMQAVEVRGGGKGRAAYYTVPDQLFCTWYQMRYLRRHRRRIEMFVEVLQIWFEEEARLRALQELVENAGRSKGKAAREMAMTAEYFAQTFAGTPHQAEAQNKMVRTWLKLDVREAARFVAEMKGAPREQVALALVNRGYAKRMQEDFEGALADYSAVVEMEEAPMPIRMGAASNAFRVVWQQGEREKGQAVLRAVGRAIEPLDAGERFQHLFGFLHLLAGPAMETGWAEALQLLLENEPEESAEKLSFLKPVAEVLETGDVSRLDPLPPEQREFALEVLKKFEA